ncbi:hypothetical protein E8D34_10045 [Nocardioides sp. GY 10113]|nr:hypothetical protein E8D34_10045 [Nocardioides sp. GY 10113]
MLVAPVDGAGRERAMRRRVIIGAAGIAVAAAVAAGGVAVATGGGDDGPESHRYTPEQAAKAKEAALAATGGGTVNSVETDDEDGATYEVEVTTPAGDTVDVRLDERFRVVVIEGDSEGG